MSIFFIIFFVVIVVLIALEILRSTKKKPSYGVESVTDKGETVRSKKEKIVADYFNSRNIEYEYEKEIDVDGEKMLTDFYLPEHDLYVEYWGLDKVKNKTGDEYRARKAKKIELYDRGNLKLISLNQDDIPDLENIFPRKLDELAKGTKSGFGGLKSILFGKSKKKYHCTDCGGDLSAEGEFCTNCGTSETVHCVSCGSKEPVGTVYCSSCGESVN